MGDLTLCHKYSNFRSHKNNLIDMRSQGLRPIGTWIPDSIPPAFSPQEIIGAIHRVREPAHIIQDAASWRVGLGFSGKTSSTSDAASTGFLHLGTLPALYPEWLGDRSFQEVHSVRLPYVAGAMYRGIASTDMVVAMAKSGMIGFFGAAGLPIDQVEKALIQIKNSLDNNGLSWGSNLIYTPTDPELEQAIVELYLKHHVRRVSASAFMRLTPNIVRYAATGLKTDASGRIHRQNHVFAKISRTETAEPFMAPAPAEILDYLVSGEKLTPEEARLAARLPIAEDITVEADSGGHTDNRPLPALFPTLLMLRDQMMARYRYTRPIRLGAAGGLGTPSAVAAAFALGAAFVLTGSINQAAVESGLSADGKEMLSKAEVTDVAMAPAADMFEQGVKLQVLKRGTLFPNRAADLYAIYTENNGIETIPKKIRTRLEEKVFQAPLEKIWDETRKFFASHNPKEIQRAEKDPKHLMALVFRWYLGNSADWAIRGVTSHRTDYQICCGPAMGAFNAWVRGSYLEKLENRRGADIALNLLEGATVVTRAQQARSYGIPVPAEAFNFRPRPLVYGSTP